MRNIDSIKDTTTTNRYSHLEQQGETQVRCEIWVTAHTFRVLCFTSLRDLNSLFDVIQDTDFPFFASFEMCVHLRAAGN
jgi:hypothetical protein